MSLLPDYIKAHKREFSYLPSGRMNFKWLPHIQPHNSEISIKGITNILHILNFIKFFFNKR